MCWKVLVCKISDKDVWIYEVQFRNQLLQETLVFIIHMHYPFKNYLEGSDLRNYCSNDM